MNGVDFFYVGRPMIGLIIRFGKELTILALAGIIVDCRCRGGVDGVRAGVALTGLGLGWHQRGRGHGGVNGVNQFRTFYTNI